MKTIDINGADLVYQIWVGLISERQGDALRPVTVFNIPRPQVFAHDVDPVGFLDPLHISPQGGEIVFSCIPVPRAFVRAVPIVMHEPDV
jgi:hypothetical protein